ncbi:MAG: alpha/beta fold hydrolase, partial [Deltaproteobacteria bacterium]
MKLDTRTVLRIAIAVAAVGYLAFTQFAKTHDGARQASALAAPIPANAKAFTLGTLAFKACELAQKHSGATTSAFCAPFSVPENRDGTTGRRLALRLALIKSDAVAADSDIVVFLAGGPGQSAVDTWPQVAPAFAPLLAHHHVLLLDQRGTGGSNVLECKGDDADKDESGGTAGFDAARTKQRTRECLDQVSKHADPRFYTTIDAVADLEAVRQALGAPPFDLVGVSYGTRMAQQYAMRHADGVRSIVLDSVAPNEIALGQDFAANLDNALKLQFAQCEKTPACKSAFGDPYASLMKLRDALREHPQDYSYRDPVTFAAQTKHLNGPSLAGLIRMFAYSPETAALLPLTITEGLKG